MNDAPAQTNSQGPAALATSLLETLEEEHEALARLGDHFDAHILALRERRHEQLDEATNRTNDEINALAKLKQTRDRKMRLLGRVLQVDATPATVDDVSTALQQDAATITIAEEIRGARERIRTQALRTQKRCRDLEFALEYAVHLGRELLQTVTGIDSSGSGKVYTSRGGAVESTPHRSFVNRTG